MIEQELLGHATQALAAGNLAAAEIAARELLALMPGDAAALHLLGVIAARVQAFEQAAAYFAQALAAEPDNAQIAQNLAAAQAAPRPAPPPAPRYLVIREWGFGFWADVAQLLGSLLLAEVTGRIPVTWWGTDSLFGDGSDRDAFTFYFRPVSDVTPADLPEGSFFPPRWNKANLKQPAGLARWEGKGSRAGAVYFLNRPETVAVSDFYIAVPNVLPWLAQDHPLHGKPVEQAYRYLADKYLKPRPDILAACDAFFDSHLAGAPFVAAHLRGSDKLLEDKSMEAVNQALLAELAQTEGRVFLMTDDARWLERARGLLGARLVATQSRRSDSDEGVHYQGRDGVAAGREVMVDTYLALRAQRFLGNGLSNVSAMIAVLKDWQGACRLSGRWILGDRNLRLYQMPVRVTDGT